MLARILVEWPFSIQFLYRRYRAILSRLTCLKIEAGAWKGMVNVLHETSATLCFHRIWTSENRVGHSSCIEKKKLSAANFAGASCIVCFFDVHLRL